MAWFLLFAFLVLRLGLDPLVWRELPFQYSYAFEFFLVLLSFFVFKKETKNSLKFKTNKYFIVALGCFSVFGFICFQLMGTLHLSFPMNFRDPEIMIIAFCVAPFLEEGLFRFLLWESFRKFNYSDLRIILLTSFFFALSHLLSYFQLTGMFQQFIIYQTIYTFVLAIFLGIVRSRTQSLTMTMIMHLFFNLGFAATTLIYG